MTNCKNCKYTDEYCASGDCTAQSPRNGSQKGDLTLQWKKGELPVGYYWVKVEEEIANYPILADCVRRYEYYEEYTFFPEYEDSITSVLAPVPSYDEYEQLENWNRFTADYHALRETKEIAEYEKVELLEKIKQLKEMLKECVKMNTRLENALWQWNEESELYDENEVLENKINEVLNA